MAKKKAAEQTETTAMQFEYDGKKYEVIKGARLPLGNEPELLTAADICAHPEAQKYLIENRCTCIREVVE